MKKLLIFALCAAIAAPVIAQSSHYVRGYTTKNGTYVAPHQQTNPDSSRLNNWSTRGNVNPYTGKAGTVDPYAPRSNSTTTWYGNSKIDSTTNNEDEDPN